MNQARLNQPQAATAAGNRSSGVRMPGTKPGSDKPTGRVVVVIVLLMLAGAALRGHLPADDGAPLAAAGGSRAALMFIVAALAATLALIALAIITRLRHPLPVAPSAGSSRQCLAVQQGVRTGVCCCSDSGQSWPGC